MMINVFNHSEPENQVMQVSGGLLVKDVTKVAISFMSYNTATVSAAEISMKWGQGNMKPGMPWKDCIGASLPPGARLPKNFRLFAF